MTRREFLKKGLEGIVIGSVTLIYKCSKNPVSYGGDSALSIKTEKDIYVWQLSESAKNIHIISTLENISTNIYYSKVGHFYHSRSSEQDRLFIAENSAGYLEKYNELDNSWYELKNILGFLIEGSKFVSIKPSKIYSIDVYLLIKKDEEEKGTYRFRIDYYDNENPDSNTLPYKDYSNTFEIK